MNAAFPSSCYVPSAVMLRIGLGLKTDFAGLGLDLAIIGFGLAIVGLGLGLVTPDFGLGNTVLFLHVGYWYKVKVCSLYCSITILSILHLLTLQKSRYTNCFQNQILVCCVLYLNILFSPASSAPIERVFFAKWFINEDT